MRLWKYRNFFLKKKISKTHIIIFQENGFPKNMEYSSWKLLSKSPWNFHPPKWFSKKPMEFFFLENYFVKIYAIFILEMILRKIMGFLSWKILPRRFIRYSLIIWKQDFVFESLRISHSFDSWLLVHLYFQFLLHSFQVMDIFENKNLCFLEP